MKRCVVVWFCVTSHNWWEQMHYFAMPREEVGLCLEYLLRNGSRECVCVWLYLFISLWTKVVQRFSKCPRISSTTRLISIVRACGWSISARKRKFRAYKYSL